MRPTQGIGRLAVVLSTVVVLASAILALRVAALRTSHRSARDREPGPAFLERFTEVSDADYDGLRAMKKKGEDARFLEIR